MKKVLLYLLMNIISIINLLCLSKAFKYAENNINSSNKDNMAWILFWPMLFYIIIAIVIIINLILGIAGVIYMQNIKISIKDLLYIKSNVLTMRIIKIIGYSFIVFYLIFFINELKNTNYYGAVFCVLATISTMIYLMWIDSLVKGIIHNLGKKM